MPKTWTLSAAFAHFGAKGRNPRWSWSARSEDGRTVVMTFWKDEFDYSTKPISYSSFGPNTAVWTNRPGNKERVENLIWARDHCDGLLRVVITVAEDVKANPRRIASCTPQDKLIMRLVELNEETGEFRAELA